MYFNYTKYIPIVFQLQNTNYFFQGHKIQNTLNVFQIQYFNHLYFNYSNTAQNQPKHKHSTQNQPTQNQSTQNQSTQK